LEQGRFTLSPEQKARLRPEVNAEALERLLNAVSGETRDTLLTFFEKSTGGRGRSRAYLTRLDNDEMQHMLDAVIQPAPSSDQPLVRRDAQHETARRAPITLALLPDLGGDQIAAKIVRRVDAGAHDIVLLGERTVDAGRLTAALATLIRSRLEDGLVPPRDMQLRVTVSQGPRTWLEGSAHAMWEQKISELRSAPLRDIPGVGRARALDYRLIGGSP
jgi:hypothetical protein